MDPDNLRPFNYPSDRYIATTERKGTTLSLENLYWGCFSEEGKLSLVDFSLGEKSIYVTLTITGKGVCPCRRLHGAVSMLKH